MLPMLDVPLQWSKIQLLLLLLLVSPLPATAQSTSTDKLAYTISPSLVANKTDLNVYNPITHSSSLLHSNIEHSHFKLSMDGRLAFSSGKNGNFEIYVVDTEFANNVPVNIGQSPNTDNYPLGWSLDGQY